MVDDNSRRLTRRTALQTIGSAVSASLVTGIATASRPDRDSAVEGIRLRGSVDSPIKPKTIQDLQQSKTSEWLDIDTDGIRPAAVPEIPEDRAIVDFRMFSVGSNVMIYSGTAADEVSAQSARIDGDRFHAAVQEIAKTDRTKSVGITGQDFKSTSAGGAIGATSSGNPNLDTQNWDWSVFGRYNAVDKPAGKVTCGVTWLGKEDCPNQGNYGYGIVTDWDQIPGQAVEEWSNNGHWWNSTTDEVNGVRNEWDRGDFNVTGYEYGPKNSPGSHSYSFQAGFTGANPPVPTPILSVGFSTMVEGGAQNDSDYTQPKADHWYNVIDPGLLGSDESQKQVVSMSPAASAYIDKSQIEDGNDQVLTHVTAIGAFENTGLSWESSEPKQLIVMKT